MAHKIKKIKDKNEESKPVEVDFEEISSGVTCLINDELALNKQFKMEDWRMRQEMKGFRIKRKFKTTKSILAMEQFLPPYLYQALREKISFQ